MTLDTQCQVALQHLQNNQPETAIQVLQQVLEKDSFHTVALQYLSAAYSATKQTSLQWDVLDRLKAIDPTDMVYLLDSSSLHARSPDGGEKALEFCETAARSHPAHFYPLVKYGVNLMEMRRYKEAEAVFWQALARFPLEKNTWLYLADLAFAEGDVAKGMAFWAHRHGIWNSVPFQQFEAHKWARWTGQDLGTQARLFIYPDQGAGDVIMFARYLPQVTQLCADIVISQRDGLTDLFLNDSQWTISNEVKTDKHIFYVAMSDLPGIFCDQIDVHSQPYGYENLIKKLPTFQLPSAQDGKKKVGFVWAGEKGNIRDFYRSADVSAWKDLINDPRICSYSLQVGPKAQQAQSDDLALTDLSPKLKTYTDTAAAILALDAVVSVDTSVAHLSASLGQKTLAMLAYHTDWRWGYDGASPYYPHVIDCRQTSYLDWSGAVAKAQSALFQ